MSKHRGCFTNPRVPDRSSPFYNTLELEVYALANNLELEKPMFIRKRVNFCRPGIVGWT